jgi:predicted DsbA family dithiol-disulfide isomerase
MFDEAGLAHAEPLEKVPNSRRALMLGELARERGVFETLHPRLFDAYWARGRDIGDEQRIETQTQAALELGAGGVPAWLIDQRALVPGAQPYEVFERVLERLGYRPPGEVSAGHVV